MNIETQLEFDFMTPIQGTFNFDYNLYIGDSNYHELLTITPYPSIIFHNKENTVGKLDWSDGTMKFEGDVDVSAQLFFDNIIKRYVQTQLPLSISKP